METTSQGNRRQLWRTKDYDMKAFFFFFLIFA